MRNQSFAVALCIAAVLLAAPCCALGQFYSQPRPAGQAAAGDAAAEERGKSAYAREMLEDAALCGVAFVDAQRGWAVGDRGAIWHTADGGRTWQLQPSGVDCRLHSVQFLDAQNGWAAGGSIEPYTHHTRGIVLRTRDGGQRWTAAAEMALPLVRRVKFVSPAAGWLIGEPSALYPSGIFHSQDAGRSWQPAPGAAPGRWLAGDFRDEQGGAVAARERTLHIASAKGFLAARSPDLGLRAACDVQLDGRGGSGWLVGDGGLVLTTADAGLSWQPPKTPVPAAARREFDFRGAAAVGPRLWAVGSPGTQILHTPDGGQSWQLQPTGQSLPLAAIAFHDAQTGWAVGALGTILATRDGGRTWHRQRAGGARAALLVVLADAEDVPLELVARLAGDEGYLCVAEALGRRDLDAPLASAASEHDRARAATSAVGGSGLEQAWQFPLRERELPMTRERIIAAWDNLHDGAGLRLVEEQLVRRIRQWRPDVIVAPGHGRAEDEIVRQTTLAAVSAARDTNAYPEQISIAKLQPWQVKKVFTAAAVGEADDVTLATSRLALRSGRSLADSAGRWQGLLARELAPRPASIGYRLAMHDVAPEAARRDFFSGLSLNAGGEARRRQAEPEPTNLDFVREQAQRQRHVERLLAAGEAGAGSDGAWLAQIESLTKELPRDSAARAILQLAARYEQSGRLALADDALAILGQPYRDTPESAVAQRERFLHLASAEHACCARSCVASESFDAALLEKWVIERNTRAIAAARALERTYPNLAAEPAWQMGLAAALRTTGQVREAEAIYRQLAAGDAHEGSWAECARAELWLARERGQCPKPLVRLRLDASRPYLDGQLDDPVWQDAKQLTLASRYGDDRAWPAVAMLACDGEFLYVAATCRRAAAEASPTGDALAEGEQAVASRDRVELCLDVNRDWNTCFRLAIDEQGATADACGRNASWNPKWFVAHSGDGASWTIEGAIPLASLGASASKGEAWGVGIVRIAPGDGVQGWTQPASAAPSPQSFGIVKWEGEAPAEP